MWLQSPDSSGSALRLAAMNSNAHPSSDTLTGSLRPRLCLYVAAECQSCQEAVLLLAEMAREFPQLVAEIISLDKPGVEKPTGVFAVPTWLMDGKIISLGNPYPEQMRARIASVLAEKARPAS